MADFESLAASVLTPRQQVLGEQVLEQLRVLIITGQLSAGTHLVEAQLSTTFQVSRGPIRDALAQLESEGLVESRRRGSFVRGLTTKDIDELYSLREAIEMQALRVSALLPDAPWQLAEPSLDEMRAAAAAGDHLAFAHADMAFHATFYDIADHSRLRKIWSQYAPTFGVLLEMTTAEDLDLGPSFESHVEIHEQMRAGELEKATVSLQEHLLGSRSRLMSAFARLTLADSLEEERA